MDGKRLGGEKVVGVGMEEGRRRVEQIRKQWRVAFWNVTGIENKDGEFWEGMQEWEAVMMSETWVEEKRWDRVKNKLPKEYGWVVQWAIRRSKKGRVKGGMRMGIRKELMIEKMEKLPEEEERIVGGVKMEGEKWRIVGVYVNGDIEKKVRGFDEWTEGREEG